MSFKVLLTCPPMLKLMPKLQHLIEPLGWDLHCAEIVQTMSEAELKSTLPAYDGWIIGDDPATAAVFAAGAQGKLRAAVKWGVGVDNVDFAGAKAAGIPVQNTPGMFGAEVADVALGYVIGLARQTFFIDRGVRAGEWPKPSGMSLTGKTVGVIGYGDIGRNTVSRLLAFGTRVISYDPFSQPEANKGVEVAEWPARVNECDFLVFTCSLTPKNRHMLNGDVLAKCKPGVRVVNVARGPLIDENALIAALENGSVHSAALDVFESEPLPADSPLRKLPLCILGTHNGSNTEEAVTRTSARAVEILQGFLSGGK